MCKFDIFNNTKGSLLLFRRWLMSTVTGGWHKDTFQILQLGLEDLSWPRHPAPHADHPPGHIPYDSYPGFQHGGPAQPGQTIRTCEEAMSLCGRVLVGCLGSSEGKTLAFHSFRVHMTHHFRADASDGFHVERTPNKALAICPASS